MRKQSSGNSKGTPTTRITTWGNAEAKAWPLTPNFLDAKNVVIKYQWAGRSYVQLQGNPAQLVDGKAEPPKQAWLPWDMLGHLAEGSMLCSFRGGVGFTRNATWPN